MIPRHSIYVIDRERALTRKIDNSRFKLIKKLIIHKCCALTVAVKETL